MEESRIQIKLIHSNPEGQRRTGRPRERWAEDAEEDLRKMGDRDWRRKAKGKNERVDLILLCKISETQTKRKLDKQKTTNIQTLFSIICFIFLLPH
jgi:hypothetical protein